MVLNTHINILDPHLFALHEAVQQAGLTTNSDIAEMMDALWDGCYTFRKEPWHCAETTSKSELLPREMLLELCDRHGRRISPEAALNAFYDAGLHAAIDLLLVPAALKAASKQKIQRVSVNISLRSLRAFADQALRDEGNPYENILCDFKPSQITLEVLESKNQSDHIVEHDNIAALETLSTLGFRIALDDLTTEEKDILRLLALGAHADYLKIDGHLIDRWRRGDDADLVWLLKDIEIMKERGFCSPKTFILAEWVRTRAEASALAAMGVDLVQGRDLLAADFAPAAEHRRVCAHVAAGTLYPVVAVDNTARTSA